ncbi:MAG: site-specific integrase [Thaumarchaeota archaeon]|nr:site-specific integrase [Nitrososphaerota archaeon]
MEVLDIHHSRERVEWTRVAIQKRFSAVNSKVAVDFLDRLRLENKSWGRIENYGSSVMRILTIRDDKKISNWTRKDIESIHIAIANASWANSTKKDTLTALKRLYHFTRHGEIADKARDKDYDPNVAWITPSHFRDRYEKIQSKDLLTDAELENLFKAVKEVSKGRYVKRNVAALVALFEGSYRPGELLNMRIGGLEFEDDFVRVHTTGKTGPKTLALVTSFVPIKEWLAEHPQGDDPEAFLWYHDNKQGVVTYYTLFYLVKKSSQVAGIKKRVWAYLFRHTSLTMYSKKLGNLVKLYGNWSKGSNMLSRYEHLASSDQEDAILKLHGIKKQDDSKSILFSKVCPSCKEKNSVDKSHCVKCGFALSKKLVQELEARKKGHAREKTRYEREISSLQGQISEIREILAELVQK